MAEAIARDKYHCPSCGADAHWNAAKQALVCPYCHTVSPGQIDEATGQVVEHDLVKALRELSNDERGWKIEKTSVRCQSCQAISVFDPARVGQRCDFCGSAQLVPYDQVKAPIQPGSVLPFKITDSAVRDSMRKWYKSRWFAPNRLKTGALTDTVHGVYLPYWTFDAQAHADWTAQSGYYYYTTETYRGSDGKTHTRQVRHTRWVPSSGSVDHFFDDELVPASVGVNQELLRTIEPFPTKELTPYDASYVAGWVVEQYQIDLIAAAQHSREAMESELYSMCSSEVPGDTHRGLSVNSRFFHQTFKHILVPVWLLSFTYGRKNYQVLVNGHTGEIAGKYPRSFWKIFFLIVTLLGVGGIIALIANK